MTTCAACKHWLLRKETHYGNGETIVNWSGNGRGKCLGPLSGTLTSPKFGCNAYELGGPLVESSTKDGEPWHHWRKGPCPVCQKPECGFPDCSNPTCPGPENCLGQGIKNDGIDDRCCGTGWVRHYDDGYAGENKTCMHPNEKILGKRDDSPTTCFSCNNGIDSKWKLCPFCGTRLDRTQLTPEPSSDGRVSGSDGTPL